MLLSVQFSSVIQSCPTFCNPMDCSIPGFPFHHQFLEPIQTHVHRVNNAINNLILCCPLLLLPSIFPSIKVFSNESFLCINGQSIGISASASVLPEWVFRTDFLYDWLVWSPCSPRDSQESSPTPQFKSINSLVLNLLYSPTLTSIHDYWKSHSFGYMNLCWQSTVFAFYHDVYVGHSFSSKEPFNFMAAVTICSDFGAPKNSVS